ncbi:MAG: EamA family transporter [Lentisphaerae bacterium]|nr:EamA family transporter [Lentisphaerota bacterium]
MVGIISGLFSALFLAFAYQFSGMAVRHCRQTGPVTILALAHILMGGLSLLGLACMWTPLVWTALPDYLWPLIGVVLFYLCGQSCLLFAQRTIDSSRIVPLLGLKLVVLALINLLILRTESYGPLQWLGMAMTLLSAALLNRAGRRIPLQGLLLVLLTCVGYALSDTCIVHLVPKFQEHGMEGLFRPALLSAFLSYVLCGLVSLVMLPFLPRQPLAVWRKVSPFAFFWLLAILFLYICFASLGTVNGNIIQSTRGLLAIGLGALLARAGYTELEERVNAAVMLRRVFAGVLMVLAIVCYNWGRW